jgi:hypothetical protein
MALRSLVKRSSAGARRSPAVTTGAPNATPQRLAHAEDLRR